MASRKQWQDLHDSRNLKVSQIGDLLADWLASEESWEEDKLEVETDLAESQARKAPDWGNCRRGCPPAFLDYEGFCSPACHLGAPRGEFVTIQQLGVILD